MPDPLVAIVSFLPLPGRRDEVVEALGPIIEMVQAEPGCLLYALHEAPGGTLYFIEKWASKADADHHGSTSAALPLLAERLSPLLSAIPVITELTPLPAGSPEQGRL
ncbi:putative quinol monooxygenase [Herbiconiux sp.]|uniref:putative quinol monooxygenase n=1 Tax=Herbiconiux sp. TaxID=1871186 RepID=UPI0025C64226|nr:putative quinol monooxygenase [Herbiconiux sp.]